MRGLRGGGRVKLEWKELPTNQPLLGTRVSYTRDSWSLLLTAAPPSALCFSRPQKERAHMRLPVEGGSHADSRTRHCTEVSFTARPPRLPHTRTHIPETGIVTLTRSEGTAQTCLRPPPQSGLVEPKTGRPQKRECSGPQEKALDLGREWRPQTGRPP